MRDSLLLRGAVLRHAGIAYPPRNVVAQDIASGRLTVLLLDWNTLQWLLNLYYPAQSHLTEYAAAFRHFLLERHVQHVDSKQSLHECVGT